MLLAVAAWIVALAATAFAGVLGFANGMKTVPSRSIRGACLAGAAPLGALALAGFVVWRSWAELGLGSALLRGGVPLAVSLLGVLFALDWVPRRTRGAGVFERQTATRPDGTKYFRDSAKNWNHDDVACRATVAREAAGDPPPGGAASWAEFWSTYLAGLEQWQENAPRYSAHVHELRREAGLAGLPREPKS